MKHVKFFLMIIVFLSISYWGCTESTEPVENNNDEAIAAMNELDQMMGLLGASNAFNAFMQMPIVAMGNAELNFELPDNLKKSLRNLSAVTETDPMAFLTYLFYPQGTYTMEGDHWSYDNVPVDEIIFIFQYSDPNNGPTHNGMMRYYAIQKTATFMSVTIELKVDGTEVAEVTLQLNGTGLTDVLQNQDPNITSFSVYGFLVDNDGTQYNFSFSFTETQIIISTGIQGQIPVIITMTGDLFSDTGSPETIVVTQGDIELHFTNLEAVSGEVGFITWRGIQIANLVVVGDEIFIQWDDGTLIPLNAYLPNTASIGGEIM